MQRKRFPAFAFLSSTAALSLLAACAPSVNLNAPAGEAATTPASSPEASTPTSNSGSTTPDWYSIPMEDVRTGKTFRVVDFAGKLVLIETMAQWCPNCLMQQGEVRRLHGMLPDPDDVVSISLDVDMNEDAASLKQYAEEYGFEWRFAVSPLLVSRALGNLYSAQYLNPPLSPMLLIDREGAAHPLPYGHKKAELLLEFLQPYL